MVDAGAIAVTALRAVVTVLFVMLAGVVMVRLKLMDAAGVKAISVLLSNLFYPAIIFTAFGSGLSWERLTSGGGWIAVIGGIVIPTSSFLLALPLMLAARCPAHFRLWFLVSLTFGNTVALPLVLAESLCANNAFGDEMQEDGCNEEQVPAGTQPPSLQSLPRALPALIQGRDAIAAQISAAHLHVLGFLLARYVVRRFWLGRAQTRRGWRRVTLRRRRRRRRCRR